MSGGPFSFKGRITRGPFWLVYAPWIAFSFWYSVVGRKLLAVWSESQSVGVALLVVGFSLCSVWIVLATICKRFQDRGKSAGWAFLQFVPIIGWIWIAIECGCLRGTVGPNRFGEDPLGGVAPRQAATTEEIASAMPVIQSKTPQAAERHVSSRGNQGQQEPMSSEKLPAEVEEKYALLLKYSEKAKAAAARLAGAPQNVLADFQKRAVAEPARVDEIATGLLAALTDKKAPFESAEANRRYAQLESIGWQAQLEFTKVVTLLGNEVNFEKIATQIVRDSAFFRNERSRVEKIGRRYSWRGYLREDENEIEELIAKRILDDGASLRDVAQATSNYLPPTKVEKATHIPGSDPDLKGPMAALWWLVAVCVGILILAALRGYD